MSPRRYYMCKRLKSRALHDGLESVWHAKQLEVPGTPLALDFPFRSVLEDAGYLAHEDLEEVCVDELQQAGLTRAQAAAVLAAL